MRIAPLTHDDLPALLPVERLCNPEPWTADAFDVEINRPGSRLLGCWDTESPIRLVGYICYWIVADELEILNVGVHPTHRRLGLGRRLLERALKDGREHAVRVAYLDVRETNAAALALYSAAGFRPCGKRPGYYQGTRESAIIMKLDLARRPPHGCHGRPRPARGRGPDSHIHKDD